MTTPKVSIIKSTLIMLLALSFSQTAFAQQKLDNKIADAVTKSNVAELAQWAANGGDINAKTEEGNTLLMMASKIGDKPTVQFVLSQAPDLDAQNMAGATALMIAAKYGHDHVVKMLLKEGADPMIRNNGGITAARFAIAYNHPEVYDQLKEAEQNTRTKSS